MIGLTYVGMAAHSTNYTLCAFCMENKKAFRRTTVNPDIKEVVKYLKRLLTIREDRLCFSAAMELVA